MKKHPREGVFSFFPEELLLPEDLEHLGAAHAARTLLGQAPVLHLHLFGFLHLSLLLALYAVCDFCDLRLIHTFELIITRPYYTS